MKKTMQKSIALFLAMIMTFGAMPFAGIAMFASAAAPELESVAIVPGTVTLTKLGQTYDLMLIPTWKDDLVGEFLATDITWRSSQPEYVSIVGDTEKAYATVTVEKLPKELDYEMNIVVSAFYLNVLGVAKQATANIKIKRVNDIDNRLSKIIFDPTDVTLKHINESTELKLNWNWNPEITDDKKFPLYPDDFTFTSSNENFVKIEKLDPLGTVSKTDLTPVFTEDQAVVKVTAVKLPSVLNTSEFITVTGTYLNVYGVEKKAVATVEVRLVDDSVVLTGIKVSPKTLRLTESGKSETLDVTPVWQNDHPGTFDKSNVTWSSGNAEYISVGTTTGIITVNKLPTDKDTTIAITARYQDKDGNDFSDTCDVTLVKGQPSTLTGITVTPSQMTMKNVGDKQQLYVVGTYSDASSQQLPFDAIAYRSDDEAYVKVSSAGVVEVVATPAPNTADKIVTITARYGDKSGTCKVTVPARKIYVDRLTGSLLCASVVQDLTYKFEDLFTYEAYLTETPPAGYTVDKDVTLTCTPASALIIDNAKKTVKVMPISEEKAVVTLTLTANNPSPNCQPLQFGLTIYRDVPLKGVYWDYKTGSTGMTRFPYYEKDKNGRQRVAEYYYEELDGTNYTYKYHTDPTWARDICTIKVTSSDARVLKVDEKNHRLIPIGNGMADLTIMATTPSGLTKSDTIIVVIDDSPYTPITDVRIGYDEKTAGNTTYTSSSNTLNMTFGSSITLKAFVTPEKAKIDQGEIVITSSDGSKMITVRPTECTWTSSKPDVVKVDKNTGEVKVLWRGSAVITLRVEDNGEEFVKTVNVHATMSWWQILIGFFICIFTGRWGKISSLFND